MVGLVRVVCPSCETEPSTHAAAGDACAACGTTLIQVRPEEDLVGTVIEGRFEILAKLAKGGMGTVYRALQRSTSREVALKVVDRRLEEDAAAVMRFVREARLASQLAHPNTVSIVDFGQAANGRLYLVMELVRGKTLQEVIAASGALALSRITRIGIQLCDALEAAHAVSIVHRDLKLENVMLLDGPPDRDHVKVLDFGLARSLANPDSRFTATGVIAGTPRYLAPEVLFDGAPSSPAQDLYALGVVLGELARGTPMWSARTLEALVALKATGKPELDGMPDALRALVTDLLAAEPTARPTATAARAALQAIERTLSIGPTPTPIPIPIALDATRQLSSQPASAASASIPAGSSSWLVPEPSMPPSAAFAPPSAKATELAVDPEWERERAARVAAASPPPAKQAPPPAPVLAKVAAVVVVAGAAIGLAWWYTAKKPASEPPARAADRSVPATPGSISLKIHAASTLAITFDGHAVGETPLTIQVPKSAKSILVQARSDGRLLTKQVVLDHDQTVEFP